MTQHGIDAVVRDRKVTLSLASGYAPDDFKFDPTVSFTSTGPRLETAC